VAAKPKASGKSGSAEKSSGAARVATGSGGKLWWSSSRRRKAKTIRKFLGKDFIVESCMGHIRDLPQSSKDIPEKFKKQKWAQLGVDTDHEFEPIYCVPKNKTKVVSLLKEKLKEVDQLLLATDEDREGESISWHLVETLKPQVPYRRMVFNEITKDAIIEALSDTREINANLVRAQEARRILDRLVGYTISPLLWKKVAYGLSAGRVQSVAVRMIVEREHERIRFHKSSYWDLESENEKDGIRFKSRLVIYDGKRIATGKDFDSTTGSLLEERKKDTSALDEPRAKALLQELKSLPVESRRSRRKASFKKTTRAIYHFDFAAGSQPQAWSFSSRSDASRAVVVRTRFYHLHAYGFDLPFDSSFGRGKKPDQQALRKRLFTGCAPYL
jgi:DNA topoisomerase-1